MANGDRIAELRRFIDRLRRDESSSLDFSQPSSLSGIEDGKEDIPLLEQLIEAGKEIPSGFYSTLLDAPAGLLTALTPTVDLPIEQRLREAAARGLRERDPRMEGKFIPTVGAALGSIGAYTGVATLSAALAPAAVIAGGPLAGAAYGAFALAALGGISEQGRRIARREQKTGIDVPAWKETPAHLLGSVIGLSELIPFKLARTGVAGRKIPENVLNYLMKKGVIRKAIGQGTEEAIQESVALGLQATVGRGLYDPDAFDDLGKAMVEDFKVGGAAGVISSLAGSAYVGGRRRWDRGQRAQDFGTNMTLTKALENEGVNALDIKTLQEEIREDLKAQKISKNTIGEILQLLPRQVPLPSTVQDRLYAGNFADKQMLSMHRTLMQEFYQAMEDSIDGSSNPEVKAAKPIIKKYIDRRMANLNSIVDRMEREGMDHGGLTGSKQYEEVKRIAYDDSTGESISDHAASRETAKGNSNLEVRTFRDKIRQVIGGDFGILSLFRGAEILGVHRGIGSSDIDTNRKEPSTSMLGPDVTADETLASSENASFSPIEIARIFAESYGIFLPSASLGPESVSFLNKLEKIENELKKTQDQAIKSYPLLSEDGKRPLDENLRKRNTDLLMYAVSESTEKARGLSRDMATESTGFIVRHLNEVLRNVRMDTAVSRRVASRLDMSESDLVEWLEGFTARMQKNQKELIQRDSDFDQGLSNLITNIRTEYNSEILQLEAEGDEQGVREVTARRDDKVSEREAQFRQSRRRIKSDISAVDFVRMRSFFLPFSRELSGDVAPTTPTKTKPGVLPMNFRDGDRGLSMQPQFKGASTFDLIKSGNRTGTTRFGQPTKYAEENYKVGDVIEVKGKGKEKILVEIQAHDDGSVWKKVSDIPAQEWMASEGWDLDAYNKLARAGNFQVRYKYLSPAQVTTPTPTEAGDSVTDALFGARALSDINNWNSYRILAPSTVKYNSEAGEQVNSLLEKIEKQRKKDPSKVVDISDQDIINLLSAKNYYLPGGGPLKLSDEMIDALYKDKVGLNSLNFRKLLTDMTGATGWADATPTQKLLMYSRLLQLPARSKGDDVYLPDYYDTPTLDLTVDAVTQAIVRPIRGAIPVTVTPPVTRKQIVEAVNRDMAVNTEMIDQSLARLVESGLVKITPKGYQYDEKVDRRAFGEPLENAKERWGEEVDPNEVRKVLSLKEHKKAIQKIRLEYNAAFASKGVRLTEKGIIDRLANFIGSEAGLEEAARLGLMADLRGTSTGTPVGSLFPNNEIATELLQDMIIKGAIPVTVTPTAGQFQKEFITRSRKTFEMFKFEADKMLGRMGVGGTLKLSYLDQIDGFFNSVSEVAIKSESEPGAGLSLTKQGLVTEVLMDLSLLDPDGSTNARDLEQLLARVIHAGTIEGLMRDHYTDSQFKTLVDFVQNNVVTKEVSEEAFSNKLTWEQAHALGMLNKEGLNPLDITLGAIGDVYVALHNGTLRKKDIPKPVGTIHGITRKLLGGLIRSAQKSDLQQVVSIYHEAMGGTLGAEADMRRKDLRDNNLITDEGVPLNLIRFADPVEVAELRKAQSLVDKLVDPAEIGEQQKKVDEITKRIVSRRRQINESGKGDVDELEELKEDAIYTKMAREVGSYGIPVIGARRTLDERTYINARHQAMDIINKGLKPYAMPAEYRSFFDSQSRVSKDVSDKIAPKYKKHDPLRELLMPGGPLADKLASDTFEQAVKVFSDAPEAKLDYSVLRMNHIDKYEPVVGLEQAIASWNQKTMIDTQSSALFAIRMADISGNYLQSLMLHGPLSYTGVDSVEGMFEWSPADAPKELKEKYKIDHIPGMIEILDLISTGTDETAATLYGLGKALQWDKMMSDQYKGKGELSPEAARLEDMYTKRYDTDNISIPKRASELTDGKIKTEAELFNYVEQIAKNKTNAHIIEFWDYYEAFNKHMLRNIAGRSDLLTDERLEALLERPFIPRYAEVEEIDPYKEIVDGTRSRGPDVMERMLAQSDRPLSKDLIKNTAMNATKMLRDSMYNVGVARVVRDMAEMGQAYEVKMSSLEASTTPDVVSFKIKGVQKHYKLSDKGLAVAVMSLGVNPQHEWNKLLAGMNPRRQELVIKAITGAPSIVRNVVTKSLDFMARNIFRDSTIARMIAGPKIAGMGFYLDVLEKALSGKAVIEAAEKLQLSFGVDFFNTPNGSGDAAQRKRTQTELRTKEFDWKKPWTALGVTWQALGTISQATESATRVALYEAVLAETGNRGLAIRTSIELLNYGRRGMNPTSALVMSTMPFINGRIAGLDVGWRALFSKRDTDRPGFQQYGYTAKEWEALPWYEKERAGMFGQGLFLAMATGMYYLMMQDNEEWKALNEEKAANNWMIPIGGGFLQVPIPHEFGFLFKLIPEQIMKAMLEKEYTASEAASQIRRAGLRMVTAGGPTLIMPLLNVQRNHDAYLKEPILSRFMEDLPPEQQQRESTSPIARGMAATVRSIPLLRDLPVVDNFQSGMMVEYFMNQYLTGIAMDTRLVLDKIIRESLGMPVIGTREDYDLERIFGVPLKQFIEAGELNIPAELGRLPILGDIFTDPRLYRGYVQEMYELIDDYNKVKRQIDAAVTYQDAMEIRVENKALVSRGKRLLWMRRRLTKLRERKERVQERQGEGYYDSPEGQILLRKEELYQIEQTQRIAKMVPEISAYIKTGGR